MGVLVVRVGETDIDACSDWLFQLGATAIEERSTEAGAELVVGFPDDDLALAARSILSERWACRLESTGDEVAWRDEWMKWIEPIEAGGFVVHAPWHDPGTWDAGAQTLSIDPGRAFGSGHHPTTRLALGALRQIVSDRTRVVDVGCGTGILSIAAAKLGALSVLGIDLDFDILAVAEANIDANGVAGSIDLRTDSITELDERFDVAVANIVIGDLSPLLPSIIERAGVTVLSGFLDEQFEQLIADVDVQLVTRTSLDGWGCAILTSTGIAPTH